MNTASFAKFCESGGEQLEQARLAALAYLTLRSEGRTQQTLEMLDARVSMFKRLATDLADIFDGSHSEVVPIDEYNESIMGNPVSKQFKVVQLRLGSDRRLGFVIPAAAHAKLPRSGIEHVHIGAHIATDKDSDLDQLRKFASEALDQQRKHSEAISSSNATPKSHKKLKSSRVADLQGCGAEEDTQCDAAASDADGDEEQFVFPKGKYGTAAKKLDGKVGGLISMLRGSSWTTPLRETSMRGLVRQLGGLQAELQKSEFPQLLQKVTSLVLAATEILNLTMALLAVDKDEKLKNIIRLKDPIDSLLLYASGMSPNSKNMVRFDPELMVLQAGPVEGTLGIESSFPPPEARTPKGRPHLSPKTL